MKLLVYILVSVQLLFSSSNCKVFKVVRAWDYTNMKWEYITLLDCDGLGRTKPSVDLGFYLVDGEQIWYFTRRLDD